MGECKVSLKVALKKSIKGTVVVIDGIAVTVQEIEGVGHKKATEKVREEMLTGISVKG